MKPKKSLGQNWLIQPKIASAIVDAGDVHADDIILEIGPGRGILTDLLLRLAGKVMTVEKDARLLPSLREKFAREIAAGKLDIVEKDILDFDPSVLNFYRRPYKLIANIPYYITGEIIRKFLTATKQPELIVLLVQKEVAERITVGGKDRPKAGRPGAESILSLSVKLFGEPKIIRRVSRGSFFPMPKVDSAVLLIKNISYNKITGFTQEQFFTLVKKGFGQKRKMLRSNLKLEDGILTACQIAEKARAEDLTLDNWLCLTKKLSA